MRKAWGIVLLLTATVASAAEEKVLYVYNWSEYLPEPVLEQFTEETGIKVVYTTYDSNEAMYAKLKVLDGSGYDVAVPSTYYVSKMRREALLQPLDKAKLSNLGNLNPDLLNKPYDPANTYSVPYLWGTTGLQVNAREVDPATVTGWADLWRPEFKGQVLLTNDMREVFHLGLRTLGYSGNSTNPAEIKAAYERLVPLMANVRVFNSDSPKEPYLAGEVTVGMNWNGEAFVAAEEDPDLRFIYPKEGAVIWMDSLVIPKGAKHVDNAHAFIDFLLRPDVAKAVSEEIGYATPNQAALALLDDAVRSNRTVYPSDDDLAHAEFQVDVGEAILEYERYWERLKAQ